MSAPESEPSVEPVSRGTGRFAAVLGVYALAWVLPAFVAGYTLLTMFPFGAVAVPSYAPKVHEGLVGLLFDPWQRWDGQWFLRIAESGYFKDDASAAFLPLYPTLVRSLTPIFDGDVLVAGCVVSWACLAGALFMLFDLLRDEIGGDDARVALVLLVAFPTAFFFHAAYTESLFLLLTVAAFTAARRGLFALAGCAALLATLTRWTGVALVPALLVEAWAEGAGRDGGALSRLRDLFGPGSLQALRRVRPAAVIFSLLPGAALPIVLRVLDRAIGDPWGFSRAQRLWERHITPPWVGLLDGVRVLFRNPPYLEPLEGGFPRLEVYPGGFLEAHAYNLLAALSGLALAVVAMRRLRPSYGILALASVLVPLMTPSRLQPLQSMPRFLVVIFPLFAALALLLRGRPLLTACVIAALAVVQGFFVTRFALWYWVA